MSVAKTLKKLTSSLSLAIT